MTEIKKCRHCNQTIRASNGLGTQSFNGELKEHHKLILGILRHSKYELSKKMIYEKSAGMLDIHKIHSGVSDLLGTGKIIMIQHSKTPCYELS